MDSSCETPLNFRKASFCCGAGNCVEIATLPDHSAVMRDSKNPDGGQLHFGASAWDAFLRSCRRGEFDIAS